jgi:hypothetical protein
VELGEGRHAAHRFQVQLTVEMLVDMVQHPLHPGMIVLKRRLHRPFSVATPATHSGHDVLDRSCGLAWIDRNFCGHNG